MDDKGGQKGYGGYSSRKNTHASTAEDMLNNLDDIKGRVFRTFEETTPSKFRTFFKSSKYDKFLQALIYYFVNLFKLHNLKSKKDGMGNDLVIESCTKEVEKTFFKLGSIYAQIILTQSGEVTHIQQDRMFWETLYDASDQVLQEVFVGQKKTNLIEIELGRIFRTKYFNMAARRNELKRDPTNYSVRELYALKNEGDPVLNSRTLASIYSKTKSNSVQSAAISRSPLIEHLNIGSKKTVSKGGQQRDTAAKDTKK